jgi:hypothetical protein
MALAGCGSPGSPAGNYCKYPTILCKQEMYSIVDEKVA